MSYQSKLQSEELDRLFEAILSLENQEECYRFFEDICTINEIKAMAQRMHVAVLLSEGKTYTDVKEETDASPATISRINKCLLYGAEGYTTVIERLKKRP
ncbi:MAG: YerC/YecD family TrpR-related protein [Clostridia bacterium]|nr:YerC/YecD family TrpR-related protein [Clostridia bacterium]